jgi:acyl-CoA reductase-like NAD-dependent aldehyde dehydrogenase
MATTIKPGAEWTTVLGQLRKAVPECFDEGDGLKNLIGGTWEAGGAPHRFRSPNDETDLVTLPMLDLDAATIAVAKAADQQAAWGALSLDQRKQKVAAALTEMRAHGELLALALAWEIGKPMALARSDAQRCFDGVAWYLENIDRLVGTRKPVGLVSNVASWNYPLSVLMHAVLVEVVSGNAAIAKTPTDGGAIAVSTCMAIARRHDLPVSLISGSGGRLSNALVKHERVDCLAFVGGRNSGRDIAVNLADRGRRYMLEMEGVNAWGIWSYSDWPTLIAAMKKGFEYGKQRCTAYPRIVIERRLVPRFLEHYLPMLGQLRFGHPLAVERAEDDYPALEYGPLIHRSKVTELDALVHDALERGAVALYEGQLAKGHFLPRQDTTAYFAPISLFGLPRSSKLYHAEPFGPIDSIVVVDSVDELIAEMNVSNGNLVASVATDDAKLAQRMSKELRAFKFGHNKVRSRGDREEPFGGIGASWKGAFVGGRYLVEAVTEGADGERLFGNFDDYTQLPMDR